MCQKLETFLLPHISEPFDMIVKVFGYKIDYEHKNIKKEKVYKFEVFVIAVLLINIILINHWEMDWFLALIFFFNVQIFN